MIGNKVFENLTFLKILARSRNPSKLIEQASFEQIQVLVEIAVNLLKGSVTLSPRQIKKLQPHAQVFRRLSRQNALRPAQRIILQNIECAPILAATVSNEISARAGGSL